MPLRRVKRSASKRTKMAAFRSAMHELKGGKKRPLKQRLAIAFDVSGQSKSKRKRVGKKRRRARKK